MDFVTLITTLLYNTNINSFGAPVKILQQLQKCQVENADLLRVAHIYKSDTKKTKTKTINNNNENKTEEKKKKKKRRQEEQS